MAENAILVTLAIQSTSTSTCSELPAMCMSADRVELGMALIAARNSPLSLRSLVRLHRFAFDGAYGEGFDQYLCEKGNLIRKYLAASKSDDLHAQCTSEFSAAVRANPKEFASADVDAVCASAVNIRSHLRDTLQMASNPPRSCEP